MDEASNSSPLSATDSKKWIVRIVLALVLAQAIWGLVVALTANLLVPLTARVMGGDPASPLYLGKGDIDVPALFIAILEFCLAGIVAAVLNSWVQKPGRVVVRRLAAPPGSLSLKNSTPPPIAPPKAPPAAPASAAVVKTPVPVTPQRPAVPPFASAAANPAPAVTPPKPAKPKEVYYNIVGDPITMDDD